MKDMHNNSAQSAKNSRSAGAQDVQGMQSAQEAPDAQHPDMQKTPQLAPVPAENPGQGSGTGHSARKSTAHRRRTMVMSVLIMVMLILSLQPSPFAIELPGPTADVLGTMEVKASAQSTKSSQSAQSKKTEKKDIISITGIRTYKQKGQLRLVTVSSTAVPGYPAPAAAALWAWFDPHMAVMPQEAVYSVDTTPQDFKKEGDEEMTTAQDTASVVALNFARTKLGMDSDALSKAKIQLHIDDIGGPSAGMMYTLGILAKLTPEDETGGQKIAGTGTIEKDGSVGRIGGIQLKMIGAQRDGARYFLAPEGNCDEVVGHIPAGLEVYAVKNIDEAYAAVKAIGAMGQGQRSAGSSSSALVRCPAQ